MNKRIGTYSTILALAASLLLLGCWDDDDDDGNDGNGNGDGNPTYSQVDRMGIPTLNTVFNHPSVAPFSKTTYNRKSPQVDIADYRAQFITVLTALKNANPPAIADILLPDELPVNPGSDSASFESLNGRALEDDAVDIALTVTVGDTLAFLRTDNVDANDTAFLPDFPYLANPH